MVAVSTVRSSSTRSAIAQPTTATAAGASAIVMDDGFHNPSLAKDFSVLVVDGRRGIGNGRVIPAGPLRASVDAQLTRAQALVVVGAASRGSTIAERAHTRNIPIFQARLRPDAGFIAR